MIGAVGRVCVRVYVLNSSHSFTSHTHTHTHTGDLFKIRDGCNVSEKLVSSTMLRFNAKDKVWCEKRQIIQPNGFVVENASFLMTPVSSGILLGERRSEKERIMIRLRMEERVDAGLNMILFTGHDKETDELIFVETLTLTGSDSNSRVRVTQVFQDGKCVEVVTCNEKRRVGEVDGAIEKVE